MASSKAMITSLRQSTTRTATIGGITDSQSIQGPYIATLIRAIKLIIYS